LSDNLTNIGASILRKSRLHFALGAVHKRCPQSGEVCPVRTFCVQGGFLKCGRPHFLVQKASDFSNYMVCPQEQGGVESMRTFCVQGGGGQFLRFCADVFYKRPLTSLGISDKNK